MKKSTKKIRQVEMDGKMYFAYELDKEIYGKRIRLYADTKEKLEQKIQQASEERFKLLINCLPVSPSLKDYAELYFKNAIKSISPIALKSEIMLVKSTVYGSVIDTELSNLTAEKIEKFYTELHYQQEEINRLNEILQRIFDTAERAGADVTALKNIKTDDNAEEQSEHVLLSDEEMKLLLQSCLAVTKYRKNMWGIIFSLYTGIKFSEVMKVKNSDLDLNEKIVISKGMKVPLNDECINWLEQKVIENAFDDTANIHAVRLYENAEQRKIFCMNYLAQSPDSLFFANKNGKVLRYSNANIALRNAAADCGISRNISLIDIHRSFIMNELKKGAGQKELKERYGYNSKYRFNFD